MCLLPQKPLGKNMVNINKRINKSTLTNLVFYLLLFLFSIATFYAMGMRRGVIASALTVLVSLLLAHRVSKAFFIVYFSVLFIISVFLLPHTITYGSVSLGIVVSVMETNFNETYEYLTNMPVKNILLCLSYIILFAVLLYLYIYKFGRPKNKNKAYTITLIILFIIGIIYSPISQYMSKRTSGISLSYSFYPPINFALSAYGHLRSYQLEKEKLLNAQHKPSTWKVLLTQPRYKNYIVIIGESARKDYQSLYGYPVKTSPFMDTVNATIFNNYISPAANTPTSLKRMLIQNDKYNFNYENSVITLAKKAGFDTYWLSNQGYIGTYDTDTSIIALNADHVFFANKLDSNSNTLTDLALLPELEKALSKKSERSKVIFMHLMGSHMNFCHRLDKNYQIKPITGTISRKISCYLTTLLQTDKFIEKAYQIVKNTQEPFSIMYFSDHGQIHTSKDSFYSNLKHGGDYKQGYDVPMVVMSSDDNDRKLINAKKSGFDFVRQFSEWTGIKAQGINNKSQFFTEYQPEKIQVFDEELRNYDNLADDPAILPN